MIDLLVVGGGPAGLATALFAARAGLETVVVEQRVGPVDKACGEGLMPGAVAALAGLGVAPTGQTLRGIRYLDGRHRAEALFPAGIGLGVRRTGLQRDLTDQLHAAGVTVVQGKADRISQNGSSVTAGGITARYLAAADGLHSPIRTQLGLDLPTTQRRRYGLRRHYRLAPWADLVEVHWAADAEAYVTPVAGDMVGVAVLSQDRAGFDDQLRRFPALAARLVGTPVTTDRGAGPLRQRARCKVAGRVLLVGDASGYVDALTGEGIAVSLACAAALVEAVAVGEPRRYERSWARETRRYRMITETLLWARRRAPLARAIVPAAARLPRVFTAAVGQLAR